MTFKKIPAFIIFFVVFLVWLGCKDTPEETEPFAHEILGSEETCMNCHANYEGFAPAHDPKVIGCATCHGGNPLEPGEEKAHEGMWLVPGNLAGIDRTCGAANCHGDIARRVENSLMASMAGVITVNRFVFGESDTLSHWTHVRELGKDRAADVHLRHLCASCHLGNEKTEPGPVGEQSRGGGCIACHLDYSQQEQFLTSVTDTSKKFHPAVNLRITNDHCFGCHSRSGRISTNYEGWHETTLGPESYAGKEGYRLLADGRIFQQKEPDVHHEAGLDCIDCHGAREVMGDGNRYLHEEEAVTIRCADCHFAEAPATASYDELSLESRKILQLRGADQFDSRFVREGKTGQPLANVVIAEDGKAFMVGKNSGKRYPLVPPAETCTRGDAHAALTCSACHTGWAPQCVGCHNTYDRTEMAFDLLDKKVVEGKWVEHLGVFFAEPPTLGVVEREGTREIKPFVPGMILTIDKSGFPGNGSEPDIFHRLFAPVAPHTSNREGRTCESCHRNPLALGYGRGELVLEKNGRTAGWHFIPEYQNSAEDGLPQDAWTGFLDYPDRVAATRPNARPFTVAEQEKILRVGVCLSCHAGDSKVMQRGLENFERVRQERKEACLDYEQ